MEYDSHGKLVHRQDELDGNSDGTAETRVEVLNTYNSRGQLVNAVSNSDFNADGTIDYVSVVDVVYDGVKK